MNIIGLEELINLAYDKGLITLFEKQELLNIYYDLEYDAEAYQDTLYDDDEDE